MMRSARIADRELLVGTLLVMAAYLLSRAVLYDQLPVLGPERKLDWNLWFQRDLWMTVPRLLGFTVCVTLTAASADWRRFGWHTRLPIVVTALLTLETLGWILRFLARQPELVFTPKQVTLGWLTTLPVALFEEASFRGLLFTLLCARMSARAAATLASLAFMAYHVQAQSVLGWPLLFLNGFVLCAAKHAGAGLLWLMLAHELIDSLWFHLGHGAMTAPAYLLMGWMCALAAAGWAAVLLRD